MRRIRRLALLSAALVLIALPVDAQLYCVNCDTGGEGCIVTEGKEGFYECTDMGGGACLLEQPGCSGIALLRDLGADGLRVPLMPEQRDAARSWSNVTFEGELPAGLIVTLAADGREVLRDCSGAIVGRRPEATWLSDADRADGAAIRI